jgi:Zn-dependent peptidase ImmA (M78 family)
VKKSYVIKGQKYQVKYVILNDVMGLCDPNKHMIYIHKFLSKKDKELVLYHELGHALLFEIGLQQTSIPMDIHEIIVENFSGLIYQILQER